ncbi:MAG: hypothetical protein LAP61_29520 [Acidobacteriia bacterium]|nr:hypothetical protein [Terriglobia bacterium]
MALPRSKCAETLPPCEMPAGRRLNGGAALVQIEDSDSGSEGYTFDLFWGNEPAGSGGFRSDRENTPPDRRDQRDQNDRGFRPPDNRPPDRGEFRRDRRMTEEQAFDVCRRSIRDQATSRFRTPKIDIRNVRMDDNPGRRDWITGDVAVRRRFGRQNIFGFTCSVNFDTGEVRSTHTRNSPPHPGSAPDTTESMGTQRPLPFIQVQRWTDRPQIHVGVTERIDGSEHQACQVGGSSTGSLRGPWADVMRLFAKGNNDPRAAS